MAFPTSVNDQITDSVTQANTKVLGDAPAIAMGNLYQATAQALRARLERLRGRDGADSRTVLNLTWMHHVDPDHATAA